MSSRKLAIALFGALGASVVAAASRADEADPRIGPEVDKICFAHTISGWRAYDGDATGVLLEQGVNDWYLAEVTGTCRSSDFRSTETIAIESHPEGGCLTAGDKIILRGGGGFVQHCLITDIYEWDDEAEADDATQDTEDAPEDAED